VIYAGVEVSRKEYKKYKNIYRNIYINKQSKADISQRNLYRTGPKTKTVEKRKLKSEKQICSEVSVNSPGNPWSQC